MKSGGVIQLIAIMFLILTLFANTNVEAYSEGTTLNYEITSMSRVEIRSQGETLELKVSTRAELFIKIRKIYTRKVHVDVEVVVRDIKILDLKPEKYRSEIESEISKLKNEIYRDSGSISYPTTVNYLVGVMSYFKYSSYVAEIAGRVEQESVKIKDMKITTWKFIPCTYIFTEVSYSERRYLTIISAYGEDKTYYDMIGLFPLSSKGKIVVEVSESGVSGNYGKFSLDYEIRLKNIDVVKHFKHKKYLVSLENDRVDLYLSSMNLKVLDIRADGNKLVMNVAGEGIGSITLFSSSSNKIRMVLIDGEPAEYVTTGNGKIMVRIPVYFSERTVEIIFEEDIKSIREGMIIDTGMISLLIGVPLLVLIIVGVVVWMRKRKAPQAPLPPTPPPPSQPPTTPSSPSSFHVIPIFFSCF